MPIMPTPKPKDVKVIFAQLVTNEPGFVICEHYVLYTNLRFGLEPDTGWVYPSSEIDFETAVPEGGSCYSVIYQISGSRISAPVIVEGDESIKMACYRHFTVPRDVLHVRRDLPKDKRN